MVKHVVVLGAGISGLSAAWRLCDNGIRVDVLESSPSVGGLAGTFRKDNYCLDFGPHSFFSDDQQIVNTVLRLFENKLEPQQREVKFYYRGKYLDYPLTAQSILLQMGLWSGIQAALSFLKGVLFPSKRVATEEEDETVEDWAITSFGEYLYRSFFKVYTEQFWGIPCSELSSRSIPTHTRMSFMNTLRLLLHRKASKAGDSLIEREMLPTYYPDTGFGEIAELTAKVIEEKQGHIHLGCRVEGVTELPDGKMRTFYQCNGQTKEMDSDYIISTIPLPLLVKMLNPPPPPEVQAATDKLDYRSLVVLGMLTHKQNILNCGYIYLLNQPFNRISEMNEFSSRTSPPGENILAVEITCMQDSPVWTATKEELFDMCIGNLAEDGFLTPSDVKRLFLVKAPYAYPIYRKDYRVNLNRLTGYLKKYRSLATLGRCGEFIYMDVDKCMRRAFNFIDKNIGDFKH
jgi:protoporphyrinogen oxidase